MRLANFSAALAFSTAVAVPLSKPQVGFYTEHDLTKDDTYVLGDPEGVANTQSHEESDAVEIASVSEESDLSPRGSVDTCSVDNQVTYECMLFSFFNLACPLYTNQ